MYADQAVDNLIRAYDDQPFIQLAYRDLTVTDTQNTTASAGYEYDHSTSNTVTQIAGALLKQSSEIAHSWGFGANVESKRQMQFNADPVLGNSEVYDYYRAFAHDPELFCVTECDPGDAAFIKKKSCGRWFFVPVESRGVYQRLVLKTSMMRGQDQPPPGFWEARAVGLTLLQPPIPDFAYYIYTLNIDRSVPKDPSAQIFITVDRDTELALSVDRIEGEREGMTSSLRIKSKTKLPDISGCRVRYYSSENPLLDEPWEVTRLKIALDNYYAHQNRASIR